MADTWNEIMARIDNNLDELDALLTPAVKTGDTVVHENLGDLILVITYEDGREFTFSMESEEQAREFYRKACKDDRTIVYGYTATRSTN